MKNSENSNEKIFKDNEEKKNPIFGTYNVFHFISFVFYYCLSTCNIKISKHLLYLFI